MVRFGTKRVEASSPFSIKKTAFEMKCGYFLMGGKLSDHLLARYNSPTLLQFITL